MIVLYNNEGLLLDAESFDHLINYQRYQQQSAVCGSDQVSLLHQLK